MNADAPIVAVTVYPDRARVTRRGRVRLEPGVHELSVVDLTLLLDPDSGRIGGEGSAQVRLLGVDVRHEYYTETPSRAASDLTRELQIKLDADQALQDELVLLDGQIKMLGSMGEHAGESLARGIGRGRAKVSDGDLVVVDSFGLEQPRTRQVVDALRALGVKSSALLVSAEPDANFIKSARNIEGSKTLPAGMLNVVDLLSHKTLLMTVDAVRRVEAIWGKKEQLAEAQVS